MSDDDIVYKFWILFHSQKSIVIVQEIILKIIDMDCNTYAFLYRKTIPLFLVEDVSIFILKLITGC